MTYPLSATCFIRNTFDGGFMLPESLAQFLHLTSEVVIMDLGSTDGTIDFLQTVSAHNPKIKVILEGSFPYGDAGVFAHLANVLIDYCAYPNVLYWQTDRDWEMSLLR